MARRSPRFQSRQRHLVSPPRWLRPCVRSSAARAQAVRRARCREESIDLDLHQRCACEHPAGLVVNHVVRRWALFRNGRESERDLVQREQPRCFAHLVGDARDAERRGNGRPAL